MMGGASPTDVAGTTIASVAPCDGIRVTGRRASRTASHRESSELAKSSHDARRVARADV